MFKNAIRLAIPLVLLFHASCAAIFNGTSDEVTFTSSPPGALVIAGKKEGTTPCSLKISRSVDDVTFRSPEYGERKVKLKSSFQIGWVFMDILFTPGFGASGFLVDLVTQAWWNHPGVVDCDFTKPADQSKSEKVATANASRGPGPP